MIVKLFITCKSLCSNKKKNFLGQFSQHNLFIFHDVSHLRFCGSKTMNMKAMGAMGATSVITRGFGINIHIPFYYFQSLARSLLQQCVIILMILADTPVPCKSNSDLFVFFSKLNSDHHRLRKGKIQSGPIQD